MPTYPEDEFDRLPPTGRKGAHRQESALSQRSAYVIIAIVALIAILLVVGVINIIRTSFHDPEAQVQDPPAATESASPGEESSDESDETVAAVDRESVVVAVFNSSLVNGAATVFAEAVEANGWVVDEVGNYPSADTVSVVYYSTAENEVQAAALAEELGIEEIQESTDFSADITVVIASDIAEQGPPGAEGDGAADGAETQEDPAAPQG